MQHSILEKLRPFLSEPVDSECKVVYILAESRKLLDTYPLDRQSFALRLYCHWALHINLTFASTTKQFLSAVEEFILQHLMGPRDAASMERQSQRVRNLIFLDAFRIQFREFLVAYNLPTELCDNDARWIQFILHYAGVIEDGSLSCEARGEPLQYLESVVFSRGTVEQTWGYLPFTMTWLVHFRDSSSYLVHAQAARRENGSETVAWQIEHY